MSELNEERNPETKPNEARLVFIAVSVIAFVWFCLFIALPAISGKSGVAQKIQQDLKQEATENVSQ